MSTLIDIFAVVVPAVIIGGVSLLGAFVSGVRTERKHSGEDRDWLRSELRQANERLYAVSREPGAVIPPREPEKVPSIELPAELEAVASSWESADVQATLRAQFMKQLGEGLSPLEIKRRYLDS